MDRIDNSKTASLRDIFQKSMQIVTVSHTRPDGDAVGSSFGMARWLRSRGKQVTTIFPDPVPATLDFLFTDADRNACLFYTESPAACAEALQAADLVVCLDFPQFRRAEGLEPFLRDSKACKILIDHHPGPETGSFDLCFSETDISSASELAFWVLDAIGAQLPLDAATALMAGMTTDTNNFANSTFPSTLEMAARMLDLGVDRDALIADIYHSYDERRLRAMGLLLQEMTLTPDGVAYMILSAERRDALGLGDGDTEGFVNLPLAIRNVRMSIFLREEEGVYRVSIRSKRGCSAKQMASKWFHGGGHEMAAGGKLFFPQDILTPGDAAAYIEKVTHEDLC